MHILTSQFSYRISLTRYDKEEEGGEKIDVFREQQRHRIS